MQNEKDPDAAEKAWERGRAARFARMNPKRDTTPYRPHVHIPTCGWPRGAFACSCPESK